jgi:hypothetical protein
VPAPSEVLKLCAPGIARMAVGDEVTGRMGSGSTNCGMVGETGGMSGPLKPRRAIRLPPKAAPVPANALV